MRTSRRGIALLSGVSVAALVAAVAAMVMLATGLDTDGDGTDAPDRPIVIVHSPTFTGSTQPRGAASPQAAAGPSPPDRVVAHVRQAFPFLTDLDFRCDTGGCAVLATIPPPPNSDAAFLKARQEMLLGGLAKVIDAEGYQSVGPVHMDEIDSNVFRIRAAAIARPAAATGG